MKILLITPPLTQLNTPYPATTVLKGFLSPKGHSVDQMDLGIDLINKIYSRQSLSELKLPQDYINTVDAVMSFLQGRDKTLAVRIANETFLPQGKRFQQIADLEWAFGYSGLDDKAKHLATLYIEDIADYIREKIAPHFDLIRYAEKIALAAPTFDNIEKSLQKTSQTNPIDKWMIELLEARIKNTSPQAVGFTIPFPGCLYAALKCCQYIKKQDPNITIMMGGGYVNTELQEISDTRIFQYIDYLLLNDGELPMLRLLDFLENKSSKEELVRTYYIDKNLDKDKQLVYSGNDDSNIAFAETGTPDFSGLPLSKYLSLIELTNPMHKLWTDGLWNKMTLAHGCYWAKCAFCDTHLDYIGRYDAPSVQVALERMNSISEQTGQTGFHFTDEALPPKLLKELSQEIIHQGKVFSFWGNIRFEKSYTPQLASLLAQAGCIAVSGGLEVASDRLLTLMNKGVSIAQAAASCLNLTNEGIMVHTYLMYGFPSETLQETIDSLEVVRQLFDNGLIQSAFWHRYSMTIHSPSGKNPEKYGASRLDSKANPFANNSVEFTDHQSINLDALGKGLHKATYNFMHGIGLDFSLQDWFDIKIPKTNVKKRCF